MLQRALAVLDSGKKRKVEESQEMSSPGRKVSLLLDSDESDCSRNVVCLSKDKGCLESGSGFALSDPELDSIAVAWSQNNPRKEPEMESEDAVFKELQELLSEHEPSGSKV